MCKTNLCKKKIPVINSEFMSKDLWQYLQASKQTFLITLLSSTRMPVVTKQGHSPNPTSP